MKIGMVCSDERMMQVADNLKKDYVVYRIQEDTDFLTLPQLDAFVLPVKGMNEEHNVQMWNSYMHIPSSFWKIQGKEMVVFQGIENEAAKKLNVEVDYYMNAEEVITQNAILTAEGVLNELISHTCKSIYAITIDIVGYGHCGKAIYTMLKNLHTHVRVIRRDCVMSKEFLPIKEWKECGDVIIYTAPVQILDDAQIRSWSKTPLFLDISTPVLFHEEQIHRLHLNYYKISNLPGRFACISAGNIIADHIRRRLHEE